MRLLIALTIQFATWTAMAQTPRVLTFSQWKGQQITDAHNRVARLANRLVLLRRDAKNPDEIRATEAELFSAQEAWEITKEFTIDQYVATYFMTFADSPASLRELTEVMPRGELAELLAAVMRGHLGAAGVSRTAATKVLTNTPRSSL